MNKKKYLILGYVRTGTHKVKEILYKNFDSNYSFSQIQFIKQKIFFNRNKNYIILDFKKKII